MRGGLGGVVVGLFLLIQSRQHQDHLVAFVRSGQLSTREGPSGTVLGVKGRRALRKEWPVMRTMVGHMVGVEDRQVGWVKVWRVSHWVLYAEAGTLSIGEYGIKRI